MNDFVALLVRQLTLQLRSHGVTAAPAQIQGVAGNLVYTVLEALTCRCGEHFTYGRTGLLTCIGCGASPVRIGGMNEEPLRGV